MAHKTITISDKAYNFLSKYKGKKESFTDVILKITKKREHNLLNYIKNMEKNDDLAKSTEEVIEDRKVIFLKDVDL